MCHVVILKPPLDVCDIILARLVLPRLKTGAAHRIYACQSRPRE
jgi:hypothetical protein